MNISKIKDALQKFKLDGWLFYDFHNRDTVAYDILGLDKKKMTTRRWFYLIPSRDEPVKFVHAIEQERLDELPGNKIIYSGWKELHEKLSSLLASYKTICMQYSPMNNIPTISLVDAGTIELIKSFSIKIHSSAPLVQLFKSSLNDQQIISHKNAAVKVQQIKNDAFALIENSLRTNRKINEYEVQQFILTEFKKMNLTCEDENPIVAVNDHAVNPHFAPLPSNAYSIVKGDRILIDLWAKETSADAVYYDITWCGYAGKNPDDEYKKLFSIITEARDKVIDFISERLAKKQEIFGWKADDICRKHIIDSGYGNYFIHRTGHSIDTTVHGSGVNLDNLETKDDRILMPGSCFSIEPGIYKKPYGVRTEINGLILHNNTLLVEGEIQKNLITMESV